MNLVNLKLACDYSHQCSLFSSCFVYTAGWTSKYKDKSDWHDNCYAGLTQDLTYLWVAGIFGRQKALRVFLLASSNTLHVQESLSNFEVCSETSNNCSELFSSFEK